MNKKIFSDSAWMASAQVVTVILGIATVAVLTRSLTKSEYGQYQLVISYLAVVNITSLPGMNTAIIKAVLMGQDAFFYPILKLCFYSSLAGLLFLVSGGIYLISQEGADPMPGILLILAGSAFPVFALEKWDGVLQGKRDFKTSRMLSMLASLLSLAVIGATAYLSGKLVYTFLAYCVVRIFTVLLGLGVVKRRLERTELDPAVHKDLKLFGWKMTGLAIFAILTSQVDRLVIGVINPAMLAVYHVGAIIPRAIKQNAKVIQSVPTMHWASLSIKDHSDRIKKYGLLFLGAGLLVTGAVWVVTPWFIPLLFGSGYADSVPIAQWLSITVGFLFFQSMVMNLNIYQEDGTYFRRVSAITLVLKVLLLALLVKKYQLYGVVISVIVSEMFSFTCYLYKFIFVRAPVLEE